MPQLMPARAPPDASAFRRCLPPPTRRAHRSPLLARRLATGRPSRERADRADSAAPSACSFAVAAVSLPLAPTQLAQPTPCLSGRESSAYRPCGGIRALAPCSLVPARPQRGTHRCYHAGCGLGLCSGGRRRPARRPTLERHRGPASFNAAPRELEPRRRRQHRRRQRRRRGGCGGFGRRALRRPRRRGLPARRRHSRCGRAACCAGGGQAAEGKVN
eukprot:363433-Chlamydomonas_euryale.AAC.18